MKPLTINRNGHTYELTLINKGFGVSHPYSYKLTKDGADFTEGGGASTEQMTINEAKADIDNDVAPVETPQTMTTSVLYGKKQLEEDWQYTLITDKKDQFEQAKEWAMTQGYTTFITRDIDMAIAPDFSKVVK